MEISQRFSAWFETNSQGFVESEDFHGVYLKVQGNQYGREQEVQDYLLTVDMAKHYIALEGTEKKDFLDLGQFDLGLKIEKAVK